jgi:hypothetical protein
VAVHLALAMAALRLRAQADQASSSFLTQAHNEALAAQ